jgi:hypothetical protein
LPEIFNPGHRPSSPLFPEELVYCSVDDIANFLQLPLPDPVALAANSTIDGSDLKLPITGANYRRWKIESGTSITVYDDADALGKTYTVSGIESAGSGNISVIVPKEASEAFTTADNANIQIESAFTNSKERGLTKSQVETLIRSKQDYIDTVCRMSWRPHIVADEYYNFTTFKPYRRRYYTDYVGAVYLRNRSIQRILRLSVWQGDKYRELGASIARLEVKSNLMTASDKLFLCPGVAHTATLARGKTSTTWDGDFGHKTTAQNIANLINKDTATAKGDIAIGSLTENGKQLNVNNEFLVTSNSDEGDGMIVISSMRSTEEGEDTTFAMTNPDSLVYSLVHDPSNAITNVNSSTFTVEDASTFTAKQGLVFFTADGATHISRCSRVGNVFTFLDDLTSTFNSKIKIGIPSAASIVAGGTGYTGATAVATTGGTGTGLTVNTGDTAGVIDSVTLATKGTGYTVGDTITITGGGGNATFTIDEITSNYTIKQLRFKTDAIDEARQKDWWSMEDNGAIMFNNQYPFYENHSIKLSYIFGERYMEKVISEACIKLVCMDIYLTDDYTVLFPEGTSNLDLSAKMQKLDEEVKRMLIPYQETIIVAGMGG